MRTTWARMVLAVLLVGVAGCDRTPPPEPAALAPDAPADIDPADTDPAALEARRVALRAQLKVLVGDLTVAGRYDCCVEAPCNLCAMRAGGCKCGEGLRNGEPVCEECAMMWRRGNGAEPGVDVASVRSFLEAEREMEAAAKGAAPGKPEAPGCSCKDHAK